MIDHCSTRGAFTGRMGVVDQGGTFAANDAVRGFPTWPGWYAPMINDHYYTSMVGLPIVDTGVPGGVHVLSTEGNCTVR